MTQVLHNINVSHEVSLVALHFFSINLYTNTLLFQSYEGDVPLQVQVQVEQEGEGEVEQEGGVEQEDEGEGEGEELEDQEDHRGWLHC